MAMPRQGATLRDGQGETVSGMAIMLKGENGKRVIERVKAKFASLRLPEGVRVNPFYDQSDVIDGAIGTVRNALLEGGLLILVVLFLFLRDIRAALIVAAVIPLSMLFGFMGMTIFGVSANLMSLGAIDFGMIVDGSVVMMENSVRCLQRKEGDTRPFHALERVRAAAHEVARPIVFAVAIIIMPSTCPSSSSKASRPHVPPHGHHGLLRPARLHGFSPSPSSRRHRRPSQQRRQGTQRKPGSNGPDPLRHHAPMVLSTAR